MQVCAGSFCRSTTPPHGLPPSCLVAKGGRLKTCSKGAIVANSQQSNTGAVSPKFSSQLVPNFSGQPERELNIQIYPHDYVHYCGTGAQRKRPANPS
jgi:hypothetical protein